MGALRTASSSPQGLKATVDEQLYAFNRKGGKGEAPDRSAPHPRIGIGLPMSNIYATFVAAACHCTTAILPITRYFGGSLELVSMDGYGNISFVICMVHAKGASMRRNGRISAPAQTSK